MATSLQQNGAALRVRIYIDESDHWHGKPLATAILERCRREGIAGGTVFRGIAGYGCHSAIHTTGILDLSSSLPLLVEIIDAPDRVENDLLPILDEMVEEGLITVDEVRVLRYGRRSAAGAGGIP